jgi:hypothetical protein
MVRIGPTLIRIRTAPQRPPPSAGKDGSRIGSFPGMETALIKTQYFMRRKPGMSRDDFRAYYEDVHRRMGEAALTGVASRYVRHYLDPVRVPEGTPAYDVATEIWFEDRDRYERGMAALATDDFIAGFMRLFDPASAVQYLVEDRESAI